jgi:hypothetical protein
MIVGSDFMREVVLLTQQVVIASGLEFEVTWCLRHVNLPL